MGGYDFSIVRDSFLGINTDLQIDPNFISYCVHSMNVLPRTHSLFYNIKS